MLIFPLFAHAQLSNLIPCQGVDESHSYTNPDGSSGVGGTFGEECDFSDFVQLIKNLVNILFTISIPITVIAFTYIGILLLTAGGNTSKVTQAKEIAGKVLMGFLIILSAWLLVYTITSTFLNPEFNLFLRQ